MKKLQYVAPQMSAGGILTHYYVGKERDRVLDEVAELIESNWDYEHGVKRLQEHDFIRDLKKLRGEK